MELAIWNSKGGKINKLVHPSAFFQKSSADTAASIARMVVVPTAHTLLLFTLASLTISAASVSTEKNSASILCLERSSTSISRKVPSPIRSEERRVGKECRSQ